MTNHRSTVLAFLAIAATAATALAAPLSAASPPPANGALLSTYAVSANEAWAVGRTPAADGTDVTPLVEHRTSAGWHTVSVSFPGASASLEGVSGTSGSDIWAVGDAANRGGNRTTLFAQHWDGVRWSEVPMPEPDPTGSFLYGVSAVAPDDVWAAGSASGGALLEHWDGSQWSVVSAGDRARPQQRDGGGSGGAALYGVAGFAADAVWAVGNELGTDGRTHPLIERWDGSIWTAQAVAEPVGDTGVLLLGVTAIAADDVWAVGRYDAAQGRERTLIEHWDGASWRVVPSPSPGAGTGTFAQLYSVAASGPDDGWAVGVYFDATTTTDVALIEHWDGTRWRHVPGPAQRPGSFRLLAGVSAWSRTSALAVGTTYARNDEHPWSVNWDGVRWR